VTVPLATRPFRGARRGAPSFLPIILLSALPCGGCFWFTSAGAGEQMRADIDQLRTDLDAQRASLDEERQRFADMAAQAQEQVNRLRAVLEETTQILTRNSADFGAEFEELKDEVRRIRGRLDELLVAAQSIESASATHTRRLDRLERAAGLDPEINVDEAPATADDLWARAQQESTQGNYGTARAYYRLFQARYADDERTQRADTEIGVAYAQEGRFGDAIAQLGRLAQSRPDAPDTDRVYYFTALSLFGLGRCDEARTILRSMLRKFPTSTLKTAADELMEKLRTDAQCR
jgi:TolA-binding protein